MVIGCNSLHAMLVHLDTLEVEWLHFPYLVIEFVLSAPGTSSRPLAFHCLNLQNQNEWQAFAFFEIVSLSMCF